jgi:hypothetical protein
MSRRAFIIIIGTIGVIGIIAAGWYFGSPLFLDDTVDEAFPFDAPSETQIADMSESERMALEKEFVEAVPDADQLTALSAEELKVVADDVESAAAVVMMDKPMDEEKMADAADEWTVVSEGSFVDADSLHQGSGTAAIFQQGNQRVLRFEDFSVTNGPDLHVILTRHPAPGGRSDVGDDYVDLGSLKGNLGNQNYEIPTSVDLSQYQGVVIYCVPFHVVFSTATLS